MVLEVLQKKTVGVNDVVNIGVGLFVAEIGSGLVSQFLPVAGIWAKIALGAVLYLLKFGNLVLGVIASVLLDLIRGFNFGTAPANDVI